MKRHSRLHFALLGLPAIINVLLLLVVAINTAFRPNGGFKWLLPLCAALVCLALAVHFAVKRGRDLGWTPLSTAGILLVSVLMLPAVLIPLGLLLCMQAKPSGDRFGPPPGPVALLSVVLGFVLALCPWALMLMTRII